MGEVPVGEVLVREVPVEAQLSASGLLRIVENYLIHRMSLPNKWRVAGPWSTGLHTQPS